MTQELHSLLAPRGPEDVFPELALSLFTVIDILYKKLSNASVRDIYFLSREGQPLMRLFEMYQLSHGDPHAPIVCHYLEVSRRSTFMPSLVSLESESFDTLFRQYRTISLMEFLSSLGLELHAEQAAQALGVTMAALTLREADLPTSALYCALLASPWFCQLYETERLSRRSAFIDYLTDLSGGVLPAHLHLVDVGWKGTIQDNLYRLLCDGAAARVQGIDGYYVGLVAMGAANESNRKHGLLFSTSGQRTTHFHVFNENRALFEVILAADHGSVARYIHTDGGKAQVIRSDFEEEEMIRTCIFPVQAKLFERFDALCRYSANGELEESALLKLAACGHARMVFMPSLDEMNWFSSVFHVENFGVFESSRFNSNGDSTWLERLRFTVRLMRRRPGSVLGFWPWLSIHRHALPGVAYAYRRFRSGSLA